MASPLIEDFSDVAAFVQEDTSYVEQYASEDELERKIAEEHAKYKEALARRQEEVRASRPWSAPPVESPRPEQQKEREKERQARGSNGDVDLDAPRAEYEPPVRPYLLQAQASGNNLSYLSRPQSAEHRTVAATRAALNAQPSRVSLSGIEEETGEGTACDSHQASEMGRPGSTFGEGMSTSGGPADDVPGRDQDGAAAREDGEEGGSTPALGGLLPTAEEDEEVGAGLEEEEDEDERQEVLKEEEEQEGGAAGEETDPRVVEPSAEEVAEDEENGDHGGGSGEADEDHDEGGGGGGGGETSGDGDEAADAAPVDEGVLMASGEALASSLGVDGYYGGNVQHTLKPSGSSRNGDGDGDGGGDGEGERDGPETEESQEQEGEDDDARSAAQGGAPSVAAASTPRSMAMRGFVEPLPYEASYGAGSAGRRSPEAAPPAPGAAEAEEDGEEADEEDYGEDTFESYEEQEDPEGDEERQSERGPSVSCEGSLLRASPSASKALLSTSLRSRAGSSVLAPPSKEPSKVAAAAAPPPPLLPHASRSSTGAGADDDGEDGPAVPLSPAPPSASSLPPIRKTSSGTADGSGTVATAAAVAASSDSLSARGPLAASHSQRSLSSSGAGAMPTPATSLPPPAPALLSELQPSQQFALQLLKHDIEVLPQHHRAAAEAAAARRRSATARPAGAGLAAFGYLGYHMVSEELTAPSGPAFRSGSPGRGTSPGRGGELAPGGSGSAALIGSASLKAVRSGEAPVTARGDGRPTSAPHMRPSPEAIAEAEAVDVDVDGMDGAAAAAAAAAAQGGSAGFVGMAREMRAGRLLPPVAQPGASRAVGQRNSGAAGAAAGVAAENSVSVIGESEANAAVAQSRMKFDVWLDALSNGGGGGAAAAAGGPAAHLSGSGADGDRDAAAAGGGGRRPPRPMTVPASGRRRPASARPGSGGAGHYMPQPAAVNIPKPLTRPMSAQPHHLRPGSATLTRGGGGGGGSGGGATGHFDLGAEPPVPMTVQPPDAAPAAGGTAAVEVGGVTVSVYVADTLKRIVEANRWLQQLGVSTKRYRLKDCLSNMTVQLVEELPPLPSDRAAGAGGAVAIVKELTLKQFLSGHAKLKQQARKLRQATALASAAQQPAAAAAGPGMGTIMGAGGSGMYGVPDYAGGGGGGGGRASNGRPFSATFGSGGFAVAAGPAVANGSRARPASAMPYSGVRTTGLSAGGADPSMYGAAGLVGPGGGGGGGGAVAYPVGYQGGRPVRPNSANPAYGRTPTFSNSYNLESSPPAAQNSPFAHTAYAAHAVAAAAAAAAAPKSPGGGPSGAPRTAWGGGGGGVGGGPGGGVGGGPAAGGVSGYVPYPGGYPSTGGRGSSGGGAVIGGGPSQYFHRSISLTARTPGSVGFDGDHHHHGCLADDADSERAMVIEPDERGDVSRAVRQQLGSAADYCQTRRQEIARLRTLPLA